MPVISATKLQVPVHRTGLVPREALVALLAGALTSRLTLLCAPAGSGKTTLLTQWHRAEQREFAWVSLDEEDNDPVRFWSCALEALQTVAPGVGAAAAGALTGPGTSISDVVVPLLVNDLAALTTPVVLVLDDLHTVHEPRVHEPLGRLIEREPPQLHIALASRAEPPLPLGRLRARGELTELRAADLRFSDDEAAVLLNDGFGLMLADDDIAALQRRTDGWAAGLQLAGLSLRRRREPRAFIDAFAGDHTHIADYLVTEVLDEVPRRLRAFLLQTCVLDRMCASLCDALTGEPGSAGRLAELERRGAFTIPLDSRRLWYRYHPLFADLLRHELEREDPALRAELHRRAAAWFTAQDELPDAIRHALAGGDHEAAEELVAARWSELFNRGWLDTVDQWLAALPSDAVARDTRLWLARAWVAMDQGRLDEVGQWLAVEGDDTTRRGWAELLRALHRFKSGDVGGARVLAGRLSRPPGGPVFWRTVAGCAAGVTAYWSGDLGAAVAELDEAAALAEGDGNVLAAGYAAGYAALAAMERGDLGEAERRLVRAAAHAAREPRAGEHFTAMAAHLARARAREAAGHLDEAAREAARARELALRGGGLVEVAAAHAVEAEILHAAGDREGARRALAAATAAEERCEDPGTLHDLLAAVEQRLAGRPHRARAATPAAGRDELTERELGVLRLLRSELSLREIGAELFLSRDTVKTHVRNIYLKLGVGTREGAVARADELGLS